MPSSTSIPIIVQGNSFSLAIPLQVYIVQDDELVLVDYVPESGDNITVRLKGERRNYTYIPSTNANIAYIHLGGNELVGLYAVEVEIVKDDDSKLTSMRFEQLSIVESIDELNVGQITEGIEQGAIYLEPEIFIAGKEGRGIVSIVKTATSGLVDTYTITYTDNTTSTFNVTNGKDGINGQDGKDGADGQDGVGIASIAKTGTQGLVDTYTITMTNGTTYTYQVTNGSDATQVQSDWSQSDSTAVDFIKNKPTIPTVPTNVSAFTNDAGYLTQHQDIKTVNNTSLVGNGNIDLVPTETFNNFCPIIEDTRSSAVAAITGVAPFSELVDGQRIVLHLAFPNLSNPTLQLTLSNGTLTSAYDIYGQIGTNVTKLTQGYYRAEVYLPMIFANNRWNVIADANTQYDSLTQALLNVGTDMSNRLISPKLIHDNAYIVEESYSSGSLKANKMYDFGTVSSALTIPSLDATNDLVSNALNFYALRFIAGADNISITFPTGVIVDDTPTINTGDYVEIMINKYGNNFYASIKVWQTQ